MTKAAPDWAGALKSLRQGKTKPIGDLMRNGEHVPSEVTTLLGLMLAPVPKDPGPRLEVKLPKRWTDQKTLAKKEEASKVYNEIVAALQSNGGYMKVALVDVGSSRAERGLPHSRAYLLECWSQALFAPDYWAVMRRRFLEFRTLPSVHPLVWRDDLARALEQVQVLLDQAPKSSNSKCRKVKPVR